MTGLGAGNDPAMQMLAQQLSEALGGDQQQAAQALEQLKKMTPEQLMLLLALLDPDILEALKGAMGQGSQPQAGGGGGGAPAGGGGGGGAAPAGGARRRRAGGANPTPGGNATPRRTTPGATGTRNPASTNVTPNGQVTPGRNGIPAGLHANAARGAALVREQFGFTGDIGGMRAPGGRPSDHHHGNAIDVMTRGDRAMGNRIKDYFVQNHEQLGVKYVIFEQTIYSAANGWRGRRMEDRGSPTANHMDHPHISFT